MHHELALPQRKLRTLGWIEKPPSSRWRPGFDGVTMPATEVLRSNRAGHHYRPQRRLTCDSATTWAVLRNYQPHPLHIRHAVRGQLQPASTSTLVTSKTCRCHTPFAAFQPQEQSVEQVQQLQPSLKAPKFRPFTPQVCLRSRPTVKLLLANLQDRHVCTADRRKGRAAGLSI